MAKSSINMNDQWVFTLKHKEDRVQISSGHKYVLYV